MPVTLSIIIPTRERCAYLPYCIRTCTANPDVGLEILVIDNASTDSTAEAVASMHDSRIRYVRNETRLSMRDNFEKGLTLARGDIVGFIGDDDGIFPDAVGKVLQLFENTKIDAISAERASYFWPDLLTRSHDTARLPRHKGLAIFDSKMMIKNLLVDCNYYHLPCLYHGFVRREIIERIKKRHGRFFLSSQVDIFSSIALSMEGIKYAYSKSPLVINGGSARSNGASHYVGGIEQEKALWKQEDDLGFLPGFEGTMPLGGVIVESALRYSQANRNVNISDILGKYLIEKTLIYAASERIKAGVPNRDIITMFDTACVPMPRKRSNFINSLSMFGSRPRRLVRSFINNLPIDMRRLGVTDVFGASQQLQLILDNSETGLACNTFSQFKVALGIVGGFNREVR